MSTTETEDVLNKRVTFMENGRKLYYFTFGEEAEGETPSDEQPAEEESGSNE